ncbi:hypothetical protein [Enterobacter ludwigii]|uniref:hypothetical protein n=1 Tax=Enterobacter ludwigii TaxID=299767 RepID=UPI003F70E9B9
METWKIILTSSVISAIISAVFKYFSDRRLESYKQTIHTLNESLRFDLQRQIHDFNQYSVKRHSQYPELYKSLLIAHGNVSSLFGFSRVLSFEEFNNEDFKKFMENEKIPQGKQDSILALLEVNKKGATDELRQYLNNLQLQEARNSLQEALNLILFSELYVSDEVTTRCKEAINLLRELLSYIEYPEPGSYQNRIKLDEQITRKLSVLKKIMKEELSSAYYQDYK